MKNESSRGNTQGQKLSAEIKKNWGKLTDEEIGLYDNNRDKFFAAVKTKYGITMEDAERTVRKLDAACAAACTETKAANDSSSASKQAVKAS